MTPTLTTFPPGHVLHGYTEAAIEVMRPGNPLGPVCLYALRRSPVEAIWAVVAQWEAYEAVRRAKAPKRLQGDQWGNGRATAGQAMSVETIA